MREENNNFIGSMLSTILASQSDFYVIPLGGFLLGKCKNYRKLDNGPDSNQPRDTFFGHFALQKELYQIK